MYFFNTDFDSMSNMLISNETKIVIQILVQVDNELKTKEFISIWVVSGTKADLIGMEFQQRSQKARV